MAGAVAFGQSAQWDAFPIVRITNSGELFSTYDLADDTDAMAAMKSAGLSSPEIGRVLAGCHESNWPEGISTLDRRQDRRAQIAEYRVRQVTSWADHCLLVVLAAENGHMPEGMASSDDFFFIMGSSGIARSEGGTVKKTSHHHGSSDTVEGPASHGSGTTSLDPSTLTRVAIVNAGELYSTYDLEGNANAMGALDAMGLGGAEISRIVHDASEDNWSGDLSNLEFRTSHHEDLQRIHGRLVAQWEDKVLIAVPASENGHLPTGMRQDRDIYMVFGQDAVEMK